MIQDPRLPKALVIGPMKCGTSWIHTYLQARGDVCLPHLVKETFYFDRYYDRGADWYCARLSNYDPGRHKTVIEVAPTLFHASQTVPARVKYELGDIPIVVTLREPVKRAWSHYLHMRRSFTTKPLQCAISAYPEIVEASRYAHHVPKWAEHFSRITVVTLENLKGDGDGFVRQLCKGLQLPPRCHKLDVASVVNRSVYPKNFVAARVARILKTQFRSIGMYSLVALLNRSFLHKFLYADAQEIAPCLSDQDRLYLEEVLEEHSAFWKEARNDDAPNPPSIVPGCVSCT